MLFDPNAMASGPQNFAYAKFEFGFLVRISEVALPAGRTGLEPAIL